MLLNSTIPEGYERRYEEWMRNPYAQDFQAAQDDTHETIIEILENARRKREETQRERAQKKSTETPEERSSRKAIEGQRLQRKKARQHRNRGGR